MAGVITIPGMFMPGDHASRPAANTVGSGTLYSCSTHGLIYQSDGSSWTTWATLGTTPSGSITASGYTQATARLLGRSTASTGAIEEITLGTNLSFTGTTLNAAGGGSFTGRGARSSRTTNQTISNATWTPVVMNVADTYDTNAIHDPGGANPERFVLNATGLWSVKLRAQWDGSATGDRYLTIFLNGSQYGQTMRVPGNASYNVLAFSDDVQVTAITDYITCNVYQDSTGNLDITTAQCAVAFLGA